MIPLAAPGLRRFSAERVALILSLVVYFIYLGYLSKAKKIPL